MTFRACGGGVLYNTTPLSDEDVQRLINEYEAEAGDAAVLGHQQAFEAAYELALQVTQAQYEANRWRLAARGRGQ